MKHHGHFGQKRVPSKPFNRKGQNLGSYLDHYYFKSLYRNDEVDFKYTDQELMGWLVEQYEDKRSDHLDVEVGLAIEEDVDRRKQELWDMDKDIQIKLLQKEYQELLIRYKSSVKQSQMLLTHGQNNDAEQFCRDAQIELEHLNMVFPSKIGKKLLEKLIIINQGEENEEDNQCD